MVDPEEPGSGTRLVATGLCCREACWRPAMGISVEVGLAADSDLEAAALVLAVDPETVAGLALDLGPWLPR